jgi:lysophospholipase L1-like esterase
MSVAARSGVLAAVVIATAAVTTAMTPAADERAAKPAAVVSIGDSYISGEGGRWRGNALSGSGDKWGTDLATVCDANGCTTDPRRIYGNTHSTTNMCHRSTSAEVISAEIPDATPVNLACSGATTSDVLNGDPDRRQPNQLEGLRTVVRDHDVKLVVLSIGGNDLGFGDIITDCVQGYLSILAYECAPKWAPTIAQRLDQVRADVDATVAAIKKVVDDAQGAGTYQFVLQSYPSPLPAARNFRIPENGPRFTLGGCPIWDADADWARQQVVPAIAAELEQVADDQNVRFLDLQNAFDGRGVCATDSRQAQQDNSAANPLPGSAAEWVRWVVTGLTSQGDRQESLHPNYYGQRALGTCLGLMHENATGDFACRNTRGAGPGRMTLAPLDSALTVS